MGPLVISFALITLAWASPAPNALPSGGQLAQGAAAISQSGTNMAIHQSTSRAVINWQSFDIGKDAKVNIVQPNAQAVLLNRVTGVAPSQIFGQMSANGQVVLVNPNGVTFGKDGSVSAARLTASTLNISDADFMAAVVSSKMARSTIRSLANAAPAHNQMTKTAKNIFDVFIIS